MASKLNNSFQQYDYILHKPREKLELLEEVKDDGGSILQAAIDSFLMSVVEGYGMVSEMTSADKQQASFQQIAVKEAAVQCNHDIIGGLFDGEKWKCIARKTFDALVHNVIEARKAQMLRQISLCEHNIEGILKCGFIEIILTEFKRLLINAARLLEYIHKYLSFGTLGGQHTQNMLLLCAAQLQKLFPLLLQTIEISDGVSGHSIEAKIYVVNRMKICLKKVKSIIKGDLTAEENEVDDLGGGLFITHMDQALSFLAVTPVQSFPCDQWRSSIEAVLQHAMSIAQIASQLDFKMIHASGEKILRECDNLEGEWKSSGCNPSLLKLHAASLSNSLEELELRVCASVLKMYLQVFSDPYAPLKALCELSWSKTVHEEERKAKDLHEAINNFDCHTDRILQVALFAIACSEDHLRVLHIRSCLASLESLEAHLVPALTTLYLKPGFSQNALARILVEHWNSEVKHLWQQVEGIVDPAALAQVTHTMIHSPTAILKKAIMTNRALEQGEQLKLVKSVVCSAEVLIHQLQSSAEELQLFQNQRVSQSFQELLQAVREGKAVLQRIEGSFTSLSIDRILKRCELLVSCVGHIQPLLEELDNPDVQCNLPSKLESSLSLNPETEKFPIEQPPKHKNFEELVRLGLPSDADIEIDTTDTTVSVDLLQSILEKTSAQPRFTTSFLYNERTPKAGFHPKIVTPRKTPTSFRITRRAPDIQPMHLLHQTLCLDIKKLSLKSEAILSQSSSVIQPSSPLILKVELGEGENESGTINTPERIRDLLLVQNRIDAVKVSSKCSD